jgi:hypothetical protein
VKYEVKKGLYVNLTACSHSGEPAKVVIFWDISMIFDRIPSYGPYNFPEIRGMEKPKLRA